MTHTILAVIVVSAVTFGCRLLPFALMKARGQRSAFMDFLASVMPLGAMVVLVLYTLSGTPLEPLALAAPAGGVAATAGLHLWKRSVGLSLMGGTAVYIALSLLAGA